MRVDVYQHVIKDVETIQDQIYGKSEKQMNAIFTLENAYAQDYSEEISNAIARRKERMATIEEYFKQGYIGENRNAYLEVVFKAFAPDLKVEIETTLKDENSDRKIIYQATSDKNSADISEVQKIFFQDDYKRAPSGYWFEVYDKERGIYNWQKK
jgi:uncharacterized protein YdbL (DUF1318 family)